MPLTRRSLLASALAPFAAAAQPLKIKTIETVYWTERADTDFWPHWTWVKLTADNGVSGIGETYPRNSTEADLIHTSVARVLAGKDPRNIERIWADLYHTIDYQIAGGAEIRALSAIDLALWDLLGNLTQQPVYQLLGGKSNPRVRLYNTCFPHKYDFNKEPDKIMAELIERYGIRAIKIWPFDGAAQASGRQYITPLQIDQALVPVKILRDKYGDTIEILIEFHAHWSVTAAQRIARALEPYKPMWLEDMLLPGNFSQYRQLAESTSLPLTIGERMAGKLQFASLLEMKAAKFIMFDVCWCGGITEAQKITAMADAWQLPFAPHTAGGPLLFYASTHLSTAMPNLWIQESCQRFYESDWPNMLENVITPKDGFAEAPDLPGFGMRIKPAVWNHPKAVRRVTNL
jgi:galactonate dehydratase